MKKAPKPSANIPVAVTLVDNIPVSIYH